MKRILAICLIGLSVCLGARGAANGGVRITDITELEGARSNQLVGFGLVVGLDGSGGKSTFTQQVATDMLTRFNVMGKTVSAVQGDSVFKSGNISAVMVTAPLSSSI